ncbi:MAG: SDR family NAD(P)-dependent oxidoreductase [Thalassospira sp.]|jgi:short-subunit dehydrogenase|nr:SDR family NAD(P)-dependent oxidoreductase [Thalassospira sp.]
MNLEKTLWITGASSGIGEATALYYAQQGWTVYASARRAEALQALAAKHSGIKPLPLDVTDTAALAAAVEHFRENGIRLTQVVLNAGTHTPVDGRKIDVKVFRSLFEVNFFSVVNALEALYPLLHHQGGARVGIVSSVAGLTGLPLSSAYGATKAALNNMTEALRNDMAQDGIQLSLILPGFVKTPLTDKNDFPMPWMISAEKAAESIFKGMDAGRFIITFPRRMYWALRILSFLPKKLYFRLLSRPL